MFAGFVDPVGFHPDDHVGRWKQAVVRRKSK